MPKQQILIFYIVYLLPFFFILLTNLKLKSRTLFIIFKLYSTNLKTLFVIRLSIFYFRNFSKGFFKIIIISFLYNFFNNSLFSIFLLIKKTLLMLI